MLGRNTIFEWNRQIKKTHEDTKRAYNEKEHMQMWTECEARWAQIKDREGGAKNSTEYRQVNGVADSNRGYWNEKNVVDCAHAYLNEVITKMAIKRFPN